MMWDLNKEGEGGLSATFSHTFSDLSDIHCGAGAGAGALRQHLAAGALLHQQRQQALDHTTPPPSSVNYLFAFDIP
jgi:hypothetical protein